MALKNHCLFCLERTAPYNVLPSSINGEDFDVGAIIGDVREEVPADFRSLCTYLKISLPKREMGYGALALSSPCDKFLCISCFEMVERLRKLYKELTGIRRRIREVILAHDISPNLSSTSRMRREEFGKEVGSNGSQEEKDYLTFAEMFQTLVKDLDFDDSADADDRVTDKSNVETVEFEMKIELDEDDRNNFGGEGEPLFTESHRMIGSPIENKNDEHPFDTSEMESEIRTYFKDDAEQKPEIMTDLTGKKKYKKREWQASANSVSSRTRKSSRRTFPEPIYFKPQTNETDPVQQFKCGDCGLSFITMQKRREHRRSSHSTKLSTVKSLIASIPMVPPIIIPGGRSSRIRQRNRKRTYICTICGQHVTEKCPTKLLNYMEHMLSHDHDPQSNLDEIGPYSCTQCDKQFDLKINLDLHVACIHDARQQVIRCNLCTENVNYGTREALVQHLKSTHGETVYTCKHCPMAHVSFEELLTHMIKHKGCKRLICPECAAVYTTLRELHEHCVQIHPELKETYNCQLCGKVYQEKGPLRYHMEVEHDFDRKSNTFRKSIAVNLPCPQCKSQDRNKIYKTQAALRNHIARVHERKEIHKCDQCEDKCFRLKSALRKHVETFHEKIRYPCPYCTNSYSVPSALNDHLKTHTGEDLLICEVCSKEFPSERRLKRHMRSHATFASEEKLACEDCGKEFPGQYRLMRHKRNAHPKEKKACPVCGMEFNRSDNLRSHMRRHSGYRPYQCPACNQSFNRRDILKAHVNGVHGMEVEEAEPKYKQGSASADL